METKSFKLNALLKLRKNKEKVLQKELGTYYYTKQGIVKKQEGLVETRERMNSDVRSFIGNAINLDKMSRLYQYSRYINQQEKIVKHQLVEVNKSIDYKKTQLANAVKDKKILENLQKRHYEQWLQEQKEIEQKVLDELVSYRYSTSVKEE